MRRTLKRVSFFLLILAVAASLIRTELAEASPQVLVKTELGDIKVEIFEKKAPLTAANFLRYIDENRFENSCFYRVMRMDNQPNDKIRIEVIQGGLRLNERSRRLPAIAHETTAKTGIPHKDGTISMARNQPGTASSEFFICLGDQTELDYGGKRNPDGQGFAAFGKVIEGMNIVKRIQQMPADGQVLINKVRILNIVRVQTSNREAAVPAEASR